MQTAEELVREILIVRRTTDEEGLTFQIEYERNIKTPETPFPN